MRVWAKTKEFSEGKYLVVRRDGSVPGWPHFVIAAADPAASAALNAYADRAHDLGYDPAFVESIRELANDFEQFAEAHKAKADKGEVKPADPDAGPHRKDNPAILSLMRGEGDLAKYDGPDGKK